MEERRQLEKFLMTKEYLVLSCIKRLGIYKDYDDFYQVGMIALYHAMVKYDADKDPNKNFDVYAYYIILNYMKNELKRSKRYTNIEELMNIYEHQSFGYVFEDDIINRLDFDYVLRTLKDEEREIIELKKLGLKNNEIAKALKMSDDQLKYKLKCILKKIKDVIERVKVN